MKAAILLFLAAVSFAAVAITGVPRLGSSPPAPTVIVLREHGRAAQAGVARAHLVRRTVVRHRVEHVNVSVYRADRGQQGRP